MGADVQGSDRSGRYWFQIFPEGMHFCKNGAVRGVTDGLSKELVEQAWEPVKSDNIITVLLDDMTLRLNSLINRYKA